MGDTFFDSLTEGMKWRALYDKARDTTKSLVQVPVENWGPMEYMHFGGLFVGATILEKFSRWPSLQDRARVWPKVQRMLEQLDMK